MIFNKLLKVKRLIIINGVTGAIGSACLALFSRDPKNTIYGISRRGANYKQFLDNKSQLSDSTLICSIGKNILKGFLSFLCKINFSIYSEVIYIHAIGLYPFEINTNGKIKVKNDYDGDGINDQCLKLTHNLFLSTINSIAKRATKTQGIILGGIADKHEPLIHQSWWKTIKKTKEASRGLVTHQNKLGITLLNISSVICPNELITRPFVFAETNANPTFWLTPNEVAEEIIRLTLENHEGFSECELFHHADYYHQNYFTDKQFTTRKKQELGIKK